MTAFVKDEDRRFIENLIADYTATGMMMGVAKEPDADPEDGGVPQAMWAEEVDPEGWVSWKPLPSTVTEAEVRALEKQFGAEFPPLFRAFLTTRFVMDLGGGGVRLPALPSDAPLGELQSMLEAWSPLHEAGYLAFAHDTNDAGPLCFDTQRRREDGDCPVVLIDHELAGDIVHGEPPFREKLEQIAQPAFESFRDLLTRAFLD
ncbi:SMI1/KNR4 family protein [Archangium lansingense]|uniref:SMI1/KNR4 family protein n=1 Tax=Archangium lansingense TaxID=2995310 RepID=UPI003B80E33E